MRQYKKNGVAPGASNKGAIYIALQSLHFLMDLSHMSHDDLLMLGQLKPSRSADVPEYPFVPPLVNIPIMLYAILILTHALKV